MSIEVTRINESEYNEILLQAVAVLIMPMGLLCKV